MPLSTADHNCNQTAVINHTRLFRKAAVAKQKQSRPPTRTMARPKIARVSGRGRGKPLAKVCRRKAQRRYYGPGASKKSRRARTSECTGGLASVFIESRLGFPKRRAIQRQFAGASGTELTRRGDDSARGWRTEALPRVRCQRLPSESRRDRVAPRASDFDRIPRIDRARFRFGGPRL